MAAGDTSKASATDTALDAAFEDWKARAASADILDVALRAPVSAQLKKKGREYAGPCPACGGEDRFSVNPSKKVFNCRGSEGGSVISMVMHACNVPFAVACEIITGDPKPAANSVVDVEQLARDREVRDAAAAAAARKREDDNNQYRLSERKTVFEVFGNAAPFVGSSAERYLSLRGLIFPPTPEGHVDRLKCVEMMPYFVHEKDKKPRIVHRGPAMIAPIVGDGRKFRGLHFTYLDLAQAKGKIQLEDPTRPGELLDPKKTRGSKLGYHIDLIGGEAPARLVIGEGIEKTIAVWMAESANSADLSATSYWVSVDLGNLAGKALRPVPHPTLKDKAGRARRVPGPEPDPAEAGIVIPDSVAELVILGDSTSDAFATWCAVSRAVRRWTRPGRVIRVAWSPAGNDFDDLLRGTEGVARDQALAEIRAVVAAAGEISLEPSARGREAASSAPDDAVSGRHQPDGPHDDLPAAAGAASDPPTRGGDFGSSSQAPNVLPSSSSSLRAVPSGSGGNRNPPNGGGSSNAGGPWGMRRGQEVDEKLAWLPQTDLGNQERFVARWGHVLKFCAITGWHFYDGKRWTTRGADGFVMRAEHMTVRAIQDEAKACEAATKSFVPLIEQQTGDGTVISLDERRAAKKVEAKGRKKKTEELVALASGLRKWGRKSEGSRFMLAQGKHARADLEIQFDEFDADPFKFNVNNGTLYIHRPAGEADEAPLIELRPHDPADLCTKISPVDYDPAAKCPEFDKYFARVQPLESQRRFLMMWHGLSLTGDSSEQHLCVYWGRGRNGKGVLMEIAAYIAGGYADSVPVETFLGGGMQKSGSAPTPDLAKLPGVRFLRSGEPEKNSRLNEALIKRVTGGDPIDARQLNKPMFTFFPQFKLTIACNYQPKIGGTDEGIWGRMILVPWTTFIPTHERDTKLPAKLRDEASGVLNRLLDGLRDWLSNGLIQGAEIEAATAKYRSDSDHVGRFLEDCTEAAPGQRVQSSMLHELYSAWAKCNGGTDYTNKGFTGILVDRGLETKKSGNMFFIGMRMTKSVSDFVDEHGKAKRVSDAFADGPPASKEDDIEF